MAESVPLQGKIFFVAHCHFLAALDLNVSRPCATCRIMETRESVQNFAPSPKEVQKITFSSHVQQDFCQHPSDVADMWLDYCS